MEIAQRRRSLSTASVCSSVSSRDEPHHNHSSNNTAAAAAAATPAAAAAATTPTSPPRSRAAAALTREPSHWFLAGIRDLMHYFGATGAAAALRVPGAPVAGSEGWASAARKAVSGSGRSSNPRCVAENRRHVRLSAAHLAAPAQQAMSFVTSLPEDTLGRMRNTRKKVMKSLKERRRHARVVAEGKHCAADMLHKAKSEVLRRLRENREKLSQAAATTAALAAADSVKERLRESRGQVQAVMDKVASEEWASLVPSMPAEYAESFKLWRRSSDVAGLPATRCEAFFPGSSVGDIQDLVCDTQERMEWDKNRTHFECVDEDRAIFYHKIESSVLKRFGFRGRDFLYSQQVSDCGEACKEITFESVDSASVCGDDSPYHPANSDAVRGDIKYQQYLIKEGRRDGSDGTFLTITAVVDTGATPPSYVSTLICKLMSGQPYVWMREHLERKQVGFGRAPSLPSASLPSAGGGGSASSVGGCASAAATNSYGFNMAVEDHFAFLD
eukprot:Rhum_TRINITY_DN13966_c2_g1::Rhum_TRINITY_DN13966_c2_g1_i1::g.66571::m.66571